LIHGGLEKIFVMTAVKVRSVSKVVQNNHENCSCMEIDEQRGEKLMGVFHSQLQFYSLLLVTYASDTHQ